MPSNLDFDSSRDGRGIPNAKKGFRDFLLSKTLNVPNGPQTATSSNYSVNTLQEYANKDLGDVTSSDKFTLVNSLIKTQTSNTFKPEEFFVKENLEVLPRRANLSLYPYFQPLDNRTLVGVLATSNYDSESELAKFASNYIKVEKDGPVFARITQNLYSATVGRVKLIDALNGNTNTAINLITGREPLIEKNYKITVAKSLPGKAIDFVQTVAGVEFPWSEIPGDYLSNPANPINYRPEARTGAGRLLQDITGVLGSLIGIERRPKKSRKPSDLLIEYSSQGQLQTLYDNLSFSKYKPDYTSTARSQQSSKLFNFPNQIAKGVKRLVGIEAPNGNAYIGDDRGDDVIFTTSDGNGRKTKSSYYLSLLFDPVQTKLFHNEKNISEGGQIGGPLAWVSKNSNKKILGVHNVEWKQEKSRFEESVSTSKKFRDDSILGETQRILDSMPSDGGEAKTHVANVIDQTSRVFREGEQMLSRGSAIKYIDKFSGEESGVEYCRVWTKDRSYLNMSDTMKRTGLIRKFNDSVLDKPWNLNIAPMSNGQKGGKDAFAGSTNIINGQAKKYMFSLENLAWKTSNKKGFQVQDLPFCERGPNGGRVMWFPPYDLKFSENNSAQWETTKFIGRTEPIYTYQNAERSGSVSFKVIVDHPSVLNLLVKKSFEGMSDAEADNYINAFFAGCEQLDFYDLIRRYRELDSSEIEIIMDYLSYYRDGKTSDDFARLKFTRTAGETVTSNPNNLTQNGDPQLGGSNVGPGNPTSTDKSFEGDLYFANDHPFPQNTQYATNDYSQQYSYYVGKKTEYVNYLTSGIASITSLPDSNKKKADRKALFGKETITASETGTTMNKLNDSFTKLDTNYAKLTGVTQTIKTDVEAKKASEVKLEIQSSTSFVADENYNILLSFRRAHSVAQYVLKTISKNNAAPTIKWKTTQAQAIAQKQVKEELTFSYQSLGYPEDVKGNVVISFTMLGENATASDCGNGLDCHGVTFYDTKGLKYAAPITFLCRHTSVKLNYKTNEPADGTSNVTPGGDTNLDPNIDPTLEKVYPDTIAIDYEKTTVPKKPPLDALKFIIMKILSECHYFKILEDSSPLAYNSLREKLRYFHPAFHSMTPEGLNSRLTFLQQCLRPGDTIPIKGIADANNLDARNTTFGPPPICIIRIGDFFHSKIIIRDINISYEEGLLDLNPEGIGIQPMIATVQMQVSFIGGQGLKEPVAKLQNALSFNFYGNTEVYDHRSTATEDRTEFNISELEKILKAPENGAKKPEVSQSPEKPIDGKYIGTTAQSGSTLNIDYDTYLVKKDTNINDLTKAYFDSTKTRYNELLVKYGELILPVFFSPLYRTKNKVDVYDSMTTTTQIELIGLYDKNKTFTKLVKDFNDALKRKVNSFTSISTFFGFDSFLTDYKLKRSDDLLKPYILSRIDQFITDLEGEKLEGIESGRNKIIDAIDRLNFVLSTNGKDGKLNKNDAIGLQLNSFVPADFYDKYKKTIEFIKKENPESFTNGLDTTINFAQLSNLMFTDSVFTDLMGTILKDKVTEIEKIYVDSSDEKFFTKQIIHKITKRIDKILIKTKEKKIRYSIPNLKNTKSVVFGTVDYTLSGAEKTNLKKIHDSGDKSDNTKLNYYR
jgi:outer membrane protein OmpA-like peptidoglycan-associated protein